MEWDINGVKHINFHRYRNTKPEVPMNKNFTKQKRREQSIVLFLVLIMLLFFGVLDKITMKIPERKSIFILCFICFLVITAAVAYYIFLLRNRFLSFSEKINESLDLFINGGSLETLDTEKDTLSSKIQSKLKKLYEITNSAAEKSNQQKKTVQQLVSDISHQLKTPISNIIIYHNTLLCNELPRKKEIEFLSVMQEQIEKLEFLIQFLVKMSRLESNIIVLKKEKLPIYDTLACALSQIMLSAEKKQICTIIQCEELIQIPHDAKWTCEALFNILDNAIKYMDFKGKLNIEVIQMELYSRIDISDTGIGIASSEINEIFKRFYRSDKVRKIEGIGVGLYLAREIIVKQGGYIKISSSIGEGSTFSVFLPN